MYNLKTLRQTFRIFLIIFMSFQISCYILLQLFLLPQLALASGTVSVCDEANLLAALAGGGTIVFACDGTITFTNTINISTDTILDGSGRYVTLSGGNNVRLFNVSSNTNFTIKQLIVYNGKSTGQGNTTGQSYGGAIFNNGNLTIINSNFSTNMSIGSAGNTSSAGFSYGGAIYSNGNLTISGSIFTGNLVVGGPGVNDGNFIYGGYSSGGAIYSNGSMTITNSVFENNIARGGDSGVGYGGRSFGGGIYNIGPSNISDSYFNGNSASWAAGSGGGEGLGGAIYNEINNLTINNTVFSNNNVAGTLGGAIHNFNYGILIINKSSFNNNRVTSSSAGIAEGGAISNSVGLLTVTNSTFSENITWGGSGGSYGGAISNFGSTVLVNDTFILNKSLANYGGFIGGGTLYNGGNGSFNVTNSTLTSGSASNGGNVFLPYGTNLTIQNSIVTNNGGETNCDGLGTIIDGGNNIQYPASSCGTMLSINPKLGILQNNGGATLTMALLPGSPAIDTGNSTICASNSVNNLDQRGAPRNRVGISCDIGAFEFGVYLVNEPTDYGKPNNPASLSAALSQASSGQLILFALKQGNNLMAVQPLLPIQPGVNVEGSCSGGKPAITITGNGQNSNGLTLKGNNMVTGLKITGFGGRQIAAMGNGNHLSCVVAIK